VISLIITPIYLVTNTVQLCLRFPKNEWRGRVGSHRLPGYRRQSAYFMASILRTLEFLALSVWLGSDVFLSFVVAPGAFRILGNRDAAGAIVGYSLTWMHLGGIVLSVALLLMRVVRLQSLTGLVQPAALCVALMCVLTAISQYTVSARMAALRVQMGTIQGTSADSPLLAEFGKLHTISVSFESGVLLAGLTAMYLMVRELAGK
jgi:uncharacterized membrane protein